MSEAWGKTQVSEEMFFFLSHLCIFFLLILLTIKKKEITFSGSLTFSQTPVAVMES